MTEMTNLIDRLVAAARAAAAADRRAFLDDLFCDSGVGAIRAEMAAEARASRTVRLDEIFAGVRAADEEAA